MNTSITSKVILLCIKLLYLWLEIGSNKRNAIENPLEHAIDNSIYLPVD